MLIQVLPVPVKRASIFLSGQMQVPSDECGWLWFFLNTIGMYLFQHLSIHLSQASVTR